MQARVETAVDGGTVEIVYTSDPQTVDGLSQEELTETIVGLIPGVIAAATYTDFDKAGAAHVLRSIADIWNPEYRRHCDPSDDVIEDYTYWEGEH